MSKKISILVAIALVATLIVGLGVSGAAFAQSSESDGGSRLQRLIAARKGLGQVTAVGADQFTVKKLNDEEIIFLVGDDTRFTNKEREELAFDDLEVGQWVIAGGAENEDGERVARIVVILPEEFDPMDFAGALGTILSVDLGDGEFTLENRQGEEMNFSVNDDTRFMGGLESLEDLEEGMKAGVRAKKQDDGSLLAQAVRTRQARRTNRFSGEVTDVKEAAGAFTLKTRRGDQELTFAVDENTRYRSKDGAVESLGDLQPGMVAVVVAVETGEGEPMLARGIAAASKDQLPKFEKRVGGRVLTSEKNSFTIQARDGNEYEVRVTGSTKFRSRAGLVQELEDLEEGMAVIVGAKELGNGRLQAEVVLVVTRQLQN